MRSSQRTARCTTPGRRPLKSPHEKKELHSRARKRAGLVGIHVRYSGIWLIYNNSRRPDFVCPGGGVSPKSGQRSPFQERHPSTPTLSCRGSFGHAIPKPLEADDTGGALGWGSSEPPPTSASPPPPAPQPPPPHLPLQLPAALSPQPSALSLATSRVSAEGRPQLGKDQSHLQLNLEF